MTERPEWLGRYNDLPPNIERITQDKFWRQFDSLVHYAKTESCWVVNVGRDSYWYGKHLTLWYDPFARRGIGYVQRIERALVVKPDRFFTFAACIHQFTGQNVGRCLNRYTCTKCGYSYEIDSSD